MFPFHEEIGKFHFANNRVVNKVLLILLKKKFKKIRFSTRYAPPCFCCSVSPGGSYVLYGIIKRYSSHVAAVDGAKGFCGEEGSVGERISKASLTFRVFNDATDPCHNKPSIKRDFVIIAIIIIIPRKGCCNLKGTSANGSYYTRFAYDLSALPRVHSIKINH